MADHRVTRASVAGLSGFDLLQAFHEAAVEEIDDHLDELTPGMRALTVLFAFVGDVDNGGFGGAMGNSTADLTAEAIAAADHVGATQHAAAFRRFVEIGLNGDANMDWDAREARLEDMTDAEADRLEALSDEFYELPEIDEALEAYVDQHPEDFFRD